MPQEKLAEKAGVSRNWIARLELGSSDNPEIKRLMAVATALDVSVEDLLGEPSAQEQIERLLSRFLLSLAAIRIRASHSEMETPEARRVLRLVPPTNEAIEHALLSLRSKPAEK